MTRGRPARSVSIVRKFVFVVVIVLAVVLGVGVAGVIAATPTRVLHEDRAAAITAADQMLGEVVLPTGSTQVPSEPAGDAHQLALPYDAPIYAAEVDRHEFWTTTASPSAVIASFEAHLPAGARSAGSAYSGSGSFVFAEYSLPTVNAPALGPRDLAVDALELGVGETGVRADALVRYMAPRLPAQRIPPQASVLDVTMTNSHSSPTLALTVTNREQVRRIAAIVDSLPFVASLRGVAFACPDFMVSPTDTFTFRSTPAGPVLAQVTEPADWPTVAEPCFITTLQIRGHREQGLLEGGRLERQAGAILGVNLTTRP